MFARNTLFASLAASAWRRASRRCAVRSTSARWRSPSSRIWRIATRPNTSTSSDRNSVSSSATWLCWRTAALRSVICSDTWCEALSDIEWIGPPSASSAGCSAASCATSIGRGLVGPSTLSARAMKSFILASGAT